MFLALECSTGQGSVALFDPESEQMEVAELDGMSNHGAALAPTTQSLLAGRLKEVVGYGITVGPGSFTGLRIALSFLKGLAAVHERPVVGLSTLFVSGSQLLESDPEAARAIAAFDARRGEVYAAGFLRKDQEVIVDSAQSEGVYQIDQVSAWLRTDPTAVLGTDLAWDAQDVAHLARASWRPHARTVAKIAYQQFLQGRAVPADLVEPVYHRLSAAEVNLGIRAEDTSVNGPTGSR